MTAELNKLANDPNFVVQVAVGDPAPELKPQSRDSGLKFCGIYFDSPKRYVLKKAHMSRDDNRIFDSDSGSLVYVSHHPGKNPYEMFDPLGTTNQDMRYSVAGGEWESVCDVSGRGRFRTFKIRPKSLSRHGRQYIKVGDEILFNVGKMGKLKTMSIRDHFMVADKDDNEVVYKCVADVMGRTVQVYNAEEEIVAQMAKTTKALLQTAVFGSGSESTIDIAPGVDCSVILAIVFGMGQVGAHFMGDVFDNFVKDPLKDAAVDSAVDAVGMGEVVDGYNECRMKHFIRLVPLRDLGDSFMKTSLTKHVSRVLVRTDAYFLLQGGEK
ncbi:hypothetical protein FGB62_12g355 [Gracilaria domingensis]|nr:hypothetical protein FGB62_12g355 [Gracilaria domingensis]